MNEKNIKIIVGSVYILIISIFLWFILQKFSIQDFSNYEIIKINKEKLISLKNLNLFISSFIFLLVAIIWTFLLGFGTPIFLIGGFIFGKWLGTFLVVFGLTIGATFLYIFASYFLKDIINNKFSNKFKFFKDKFKKNEFIFFIIYRNIPGVPFFIANILPTIFNIKIKNYFFGSLIGMTPNLFIGASLGSGIEKVIDSNDQLPSFYDILSSPDIYLPILLFIILFIIGFFLKKKIKIN
tara:strand:+ start:209 stop:925 length:717 start_codon:yes stop_codon:yes gene_type:complete